MIFMVSTLMHLVWSTTVSKVMKIKNIARFLFLGIFLDFDFLIYLLLPEPTDHRLFFHNIFFIGAVILTVYFWKRNQKNDELLKSVSAAFSLHIFLDFFDGYGVPLFYPLSQERILLYQVGQAYPFPLKLFWEGNIYFTVASVAIMLIILYYNRTKSAASRI